MIDTVLVLRIDEEIILEIKLKMCNENILLDYFTGKIILDIHKKWNSVDQFDFWEDRMSDIVLENNLSFGYKNKYRILLV